MTSSGALLKCGFIAMTWFRSDSVIDNGKPSRTRIEQPSAIEMTVTFSLVRQGAPNNNHRLSPGCALVVELREGAPVTKVTRKPSPCGAIIADCEDACKRMFDKSLRRAWRRSRKLRCK